MNKYQIDTMNKKLNDWKFVEMTDLGSAMFKRDNKVAFVYFDGSYIITKA